MSRMGKLLTGLGGLVGLLASLVTIVQFSEGRWSFDQNGDSTLTTISGRQIRRERFDEANAVVLNAR